MSPEDVNKVSSQSPLDVDGVDTDLSADKIVSAVRESRRLK